MSYFAALLSPEIYIQFYNATQVIKGHQTAHVYRQQEFIISCDGFHILIGIRDECAKYIDNTEATAGNNAIENITIILFE